MESRYRPEDWRGSLGNHPNHHDLPPLLATVTDLERASEMPLVAISEHRFDRILANLLDQARCSVEPFSPQYHNGSHFHEVVANVHLLMDAMKDPLHLAIAQAMLLAAGGHDFGHPGSSLRRDAPRGLVREELGIEISTEQVSAILVDEVLAEACVDPAMRVFIARLIWATTFGGTLKAETGLERLLVIADIAPDDSFTRWIEKSIRASLGERPGKPIARTFTGFLEARLEFINCALRPGLTPEALSLGWDNTIDAYERNVERMLRGEDAVLTTVVRSMLAPYGVDVK